MHMNTGTPVIKMECTKCKWHDESGLIMFHPSGKDSPTMPTLGRQPEVLGFITF